MNNYICQECGYLFDEPWAYKERYPVGDGCVTETWCVCPQCGSSDYSTVQLCPSCGEATTEEEGLCSECRHTADFALVCFFSGLEEPQRAYLNEHRLGEQFTQAVNDILQEERRQLQGGNNNGNQETC